MEHARSGSAVEGHKPENGYCAKSGFKFLDFNAVTEI
jgi:hypothetical protein